MPTARPRRTETLSPQPTTAGSTLSRHIAATPQPHSNSNPLWAGPCGAGPLGGVTQSMLSRFFSCRERFRLKYILGLEPHDRWVKTIGYGNMWHACEEALAAGSHVSTPTEWQLKRGIRVHQPNEAPEDQWETSLTKHAIEQCQRYPAQRDEIDKWYNVCLIQFPEYVQYWRAHPDVVNRTPLMQEQVFDVPYNLPSGRVVRLRGKFDAVDHVADPGTPTGIYLQENKSKGDIDKVQVERQLKFDLQTMMYLVALGAWVADQKRFRYGVPDCWMQPIRGVRYNVVRRPLSGGKGSITPHKAKSTKNTYTPAESLADFYERLRRDYIAAEPDYWFFRVRSEVSEVDVRVFCDTCLTPLLENVCYWYDRCTGTRDVNDLPRPPANYRTPFGIYSALEEGGATEYDAYLETGSEAGLRRVNTLFPELQ